MSYYLAKSLETLRQQINEASPNRSKISDGWIGDAAHKASKSDHNPNSFGAVRALDITHDLAHGVDANYIAEALKESGDSRLSYIIWNCQIWNPSKGSSWRKYTGKNPHTKHVHISVNNEPRLYDDPRKWDLTVDGVTSPTGHMLVTERPIIKRGSISDAVVEVQKFLELTADGVFGPKTEKAVKKLQKDNKLVADGIVGPYTWDLID